MSPERDVTRAFRKSHFSDKGINQDNNGTIERDEFLSLPQVSSNPLATRMIAIFDEDGGGDVVAAVHGGFLSVTDEGVTILAEVAELREDIDTGRAKAALERARSEQDLAAQRRAESRLRAAGQPA